MFVRKLAIINLIISFIILLSLPVMAGDNFQSTITFHGSIGIDIDSFFGNYPDDPLVEIPEGVTGEELEEWKRRKKEDRDVREKFGLTSPTTPGIRQKVELNFYANPTPDLELFVNMDHSGRWGGSATRESLQFPLVLEEAYAQYYTDRAMWTVGRFKSSLGPIGLIMAEKANAKEGIQYNSMYKDVWITGIYNRLLMSMYKDYPYVSTFLLDELVAGRFARQFGATYMGMNLIADGFYDEKAISFDFTGELWGRTVKAELAGVYPAKVYRDDLGEYVWPGGVVYYNIMETDNQLLSCRLGAYSKGFIPQFGKRDERVMESGTKFINNTGGMDLLYQRSIGRDKVLGINLVLLDHFDEDYKKTQKRVPLRSLEVKLQKYLSQSTDISFSTAYYDDEQFQYGKAVVSWNFKF